MIAATDAIGKLPFLAFFFAIFIFLRSTICLYCIYFHIGTQRIYETAIIHTTVGDIHLQLFGKECPKTVENFCVHSKNSYFNNHIFHRVIKGFMIQTGDPLGKKLLEILKFVFFI